MTGRIGDFLFYIVVLAIIFGLVRPGSPAAGVIATISSALVAVVGSATGYNQSGGTSGG